VKSRVTEPTWEDLEPGLYTALFRGREGPNEGKFGDFIIWKFDIILDDGFSDVQGISSTAFVASRRCKGYRWACAIDPTLTEKTVEWDDLPFIGQQVDIAIEYQNPDDPGFMTVKDVFKCRIPHSGQK
jgi:hypothetical protein